MKQLLSNKWAWAVAILVLLNIVSLSTVWFTTCVRHKKHFRRGPMQHWKHRDFRGGDFLSRTLGFSEAQEKAFEELRQQHFKDLDSTIGNIQKARVRALQSLGKPENEIDTIFAKIGTYEAELQRINYAHFNKVYAICNDEQKKLLKEKLLQISSQRGRHSFMKGMHRPGKWQHKLPPPPPEEGEEALPHP